jgi:hypothetical protein
MPKQSSPTNPDGIHWKFPKTAFSICLLRFHHILWKHTAVAMTPFSKLIDEFLDSFNPLILVTNYGDDPDMPFSVGHYYPACEKWRN